MSSIIDNSKDNLLIDHINKLLLETEFSKMAVGFFYLSGFEAIKENLNKVQNLKLLIGNRTNQKTIEELVKGHYEKEIIDSELRKQNRLNKNQKDEILSLTAGNYSNDLEVIEQNDYNEEGIMSLWELIKYKRIDVRVYTKGTLHSKAYLFDFPETNYLEGIAIVGSSNLSISGFSNNSELNVKVTNVNDYKEIKVWFDELWNESEDFNELFMNVIKESWIQKKVTPYEIYIKTLYNLVKDRIEIKEHSSLTSFDQSILYSFQRDAYNRALDILENNDNRQNGVFISDVVGLGKSFIAIALISYYWSVKQKATLIICPASLKQMWEDYKEQYHLRCRILPFSELLYKENEEGYSLSDEPEFDGYGVVVIDESHHFRNSDSQRYKILAPYLQDKKVILLTATPQNNTVWDLYYQIKLFHQNDVTDLNITPNNLRTYFNQNENDPNKIAELLQNFLIRRTRNDILNSPRYADLNIKFPKRNLHTLEYSIENTYRVEGQEELYQTLINKLFKEGHNDRYQYSIYNLTKFLKKEALKNKKYEGLSNLGEWLRGLLKMLLFKRLESSASSFCISIKRMIRRHELILKYVNDGYIITGKADQLEMFLFSDNEYENNRNINIYDIEDFEKDEFTKAILEDKNILEEVYELVKPIPEKTKNDDKFETFLREVIDKNKDEKILVFSEFSDTVNYIYENLKKLYPEITIERISADTHNSNEKAKIVRRFSPKSQNLNEVTNEIQILITTDVLSEGQNLQDCRIVVNYDFHWNPVRLIQRTGRVDRIGSIAEEIEVYNFLPDKNIEKNLLLRERVQNRINEIQQIFGMDSRVLSDDEILNDRSVFAIYSENNENILDVDNNILTIYDMAESTLLKLNKENPLEYERIIKIKDGVRTTCNSDPKGMYAYLKSGNFQRLYFFDGQKINENLGDIINIIKASPNEPERIEFDNTKYNKDIAEVYNKFKDELRRRQEQKLSQQRTKEQQYFLNRLQEVINLFNDNDYMRRKIDELYNVFSHEIPDYAKRQLRALRREDLSDDILLDALQKVIESARIHSFQEREIEGERMIIKMVCSEGRI